MMNLFTALLLSSYILVPIGIFWGWTPFFFSKDGYTFFSVISCIGFALATASASLVVGAAIYARIAGGFVHYDPRLKPVFLAGISLTAAGLLISVIGVWRKNPLRWLAPACSAGMTVVWLYLLAAE